MQLFLRYVAAAHACYYIITGVWSLVSIGMDVGCTFVVIRPPELRAEVRRLAGELRAMADRTAPPVTNRP